MTLLGPTTPPVASPRAIPISRPYAKAEVPCAWGRSRRRSPQSDTYGPGGSAFGSTPVTQAQAFRRIADRNLIDQAARSVGLRTSRKEIARKARAETPISRAKPSKPRGSWLAAKE
jgi:hypothetical protein